MPVAFVLGSFRQHGISNEIPQVLPGDGIKGRVFSDLTGEDAHDLFVGTEGALGPSVLTFPFEEAIQRFPNRQAFPVGLPITERVIAPRIEDALDVGILQFAFFC